MVESRVSRLQRQKELKKTFSTWAPRLSLGVEMKAISFFGAILALISAGLGYVIFTGISDPESDTRAMLSFALGLVAAGALASSLSFLIMLRHRLLLLSLSSGLIAMASILLGWTPLEGVAKIVFATTVGLWISLMLTSIGQILLVSVLIIIVDIYSVFLGPTKRLIEGGGPWIDYLTIKLPVFGVDAVSQLGVSDIIFFSLFVGCSLTFRLRRVLTALAMTLSFVLTMVVGVKMEIGVPALPLLSIFFILANADLLYRRFLQEPDYIGNDDAPSGSGGRPVAGSSSTVRGSKP